MDNEVDNHDSFVEESRNEEAKIGWRKVLELVWSWMVYKDKDKWLGEMRGNLGLIATLISTMTFQIGLNPPGGVRPARDDGDQNPEFIACSSQSYVYKNGTVVTPDILSLCPGEAVLAFVLPFHYLKFLYWNTVSFVASLTVLLLLVSGIPLNHRFPMWLLSIGMCLTLTSLAFTYITVLSMVTPDPLWHSAKEFQKGLIHTWIGMLCFLAFFLTLRIIIWVVIVFCKQDKKAITPKIPMENTPAA